MDNIFRIEPDDEFQKVLRKVVCSHYSASIESRIPDDCALVKAAQEDVRKLLFDTNLDTNKISELVYNKGWDENKIAFFISLLNEKKTEFLYSSIIQQNSEYGETVTNFNWILKLVLGTSELNTLKYPLLQLILSTDNSGVHRKILYDINKDMVLKLIDLLEKLDEM